MEKSERSIKSSICNSFLNNLLKQFLCPNTIYNFNVDLNVSAISFDKSCAFVCVAKDEPVCGFDSCRRRKNFDSPCALASENACTGTGWLP